MELAKGPMVEQVKQQQKACDANPSCAQKASDLRGTVQATAELLERDPLHAVARVTTTGTGGKDERHIIRVEREQQLWKTISREVDDGSFKPRPPTQGFAPTRDGQLLMRQPGMPGTGAASEPNSSKSP